MTNNFDNGDLARKVLTEQFKSLYQTLPVNITVNFLIGSAMVYGLWDHISHGTLLTWLSFLSAVILIRASHYFYYSQQSLHQNLHRHCWLARISGLSFGVVWGGGAMLMMPLVALEYQIFILFVLAGMAAGSLATLTYYLPSFLCFVPVSIFPTSITFFLIGDEAHLSLGLMTVIYVFVLTYYATNINKTFKTSLSLRFENIDLVAKLREQKLQADQANIAKSKFLAEASHDLRQPLYALTLFASTLNEYIKDNKIRPIVEKMNASVEALQNLFNNLLDISRYEVGAMKPIKVNVHLDCLFALLANEFNPLAHEKLLRINWRHTDFTVLSDPTLLEQILRNLISNAIRYTDRGEINVLCDADGPTVFINVSDTGAGIAPENQLVIFEEFNQLENTECINNKGSGLGLAIVRRIATLLGHRISVQSQLGVGSTFSIMLERGILQHTIKKAYGDNSHTQLKKMNAYIVVIDDDSFVCDAISTLLTAWGCRVLSATSGLDAVEQLRRVGDIPDGILADYRLADNETGIDAVTRIYAHIHHKVPTLIVTGDLGVENKADVTESGFRAMRKPASESELRAFIDSVCK